MSATLITALSWHVAILFVGLLLLRLSGQGLSGHTAETAMARYFVARRGKALSISSLGYAIGEGTLPLLVAGLLSLISWRFTWGLFAGVILLLFIPFIQLILGEKEKGKLNKFTEGPAAEKNDISYRRIFSSRRFWLILPAVLLPAFWATALFLYQISLAEQLGWSAGLIASAFVGFAGSRIVSALGVGPLIDRWSARQLFPFYLLPFGAGLVVAYFHPGSWSAFLYMGLLGVTLGFGSSIKSALWAEIYGEEIIGTIRSLFSGLMVFSTALSPFMIGWLLDQNISITTILAGAIITIIAGTILAFAAFWKEEQV